MDSTEIVDDFDSAFDEFAEGEVSAELAPEDTEVVAETEEVGEVEAAAAVSYTHLRAHET